METKFGLNIAEQRPEEVGLANSTSLSYTMTEGQTLFNETYVATTATEIIMDREGKEKEAVDLMLFITWINC
jgi:hypothetical protein